MTKVSCLLGKIYVVVRSRVVADKRPSWPAKPLSPLMDNRGENMKMMHHQERVSFTSCGLKIGSVHLAQFSFTVLVHVLNSIQGISGEENKIYPSTTCLYLHVVDGIIQIETTLIHFYFLLHILNNLFLAVHTQLLNVIYLFIITAPAILIGVS